MKYCQSKEKVCANKIYKITYPDSYEIHLNLHKTHCITWKIAFCCDVLRNGFYLVIL